MIPISDKKQYLSLIPIPHCLTPLDTIRSMDNKSTIQTISPLYLRVGVIPVRTILIIADAELVGKVPSGRNSALGETYCAVHVVVPFHEQAVPMDRHAIVRRLECVLDLHD